MGIDTMDSRLQIVADIGGTNARFAYVEHDRDELLGIEVFPCADFPFLVDAIRAYMQRRDMMRIDKICLAVAGPGTGLGVSALMPSGEILPSEAGHVARHHSFHLSNCEQAMTAGNAVLCEKPLVLDPEEGKALIRAAQDSGQYLTEGIWTWYLPAIRKAQEWVAAGRIGEIRHVKPDFGYPFQYSADLREYDARVGGGCVLEMGIYPVAIARLFLPGKPLNIQVAGCTAANGVEDDVSVVVDYGYALATRVSVFAASCRTVPTP